MQPTFSVWLERHPAPPAEAFAGSVDGRNLLLLLPIYMEERRRAGRSVSAHQFYLSVFVDWWSERATVFGLRLTEQSLADFARWLGAQTEPHTGRPLAPATAAVMLQAARSYLRWLHRMGYVAIDLSVWLAARPQ